LEGHPKGVRVQPATGITPRRLLVARRSTQRTGDDHDGPWRMRCCCCGAFCFWREVFKTNQRFEYSDKYLIKEKASSRQEGRLKRVFFFCFRAFVERHFKLNALGGTMQTHATQLHEKIDNSLRGLREKDPDLTKATLTVNCRNAQGVGRLLTGNEYVSELDLSLWGTIEEEDFRPWRAFFEGSTTLGKVTIRGERDLPGETNGVSQSQLFLPALARSWTLTELQLCGATFHVPSMAGMLRETASLTNLEVWSCDPATAEDAESLAAAFGDNRTLQFVKLGRLPTNYLHAILRRLGSHPRLEKFLFLPTDGKISVDCATTVQGMLQDPNSVLEHLELYGSGIHGDALEPIVAGIRSNSTVQKLTLSYCRLWDDRAREAFKSLFLQGDRAVLQELTMVGVEFGFQRPPGPILADILQRDTGLKKLHLRIEFHEERPPREEPEDHWPRRRRPGGPAIVVGLDGDVDDAQLHEDIERLRALGFREGGDNDEDDEGLVFRVNGRQRRPPPEPAAGFRRFVESLETNTTLETLVLNKLIKEDQCRHLVRSLPNWKGIKCIKFALEPSCEELKADVIQALKGNNVLEDIEVQAAFLNQDDKKDILSIGERNKYIQRFVAKPGSVPAGQWSTISRYSLEKFGDGTDIVYKFLNNAGDSVGTAS
jgi:hypothetical protein